MYAFRLQVLQWKGFVMSRVIVASLMLIITMVFAVPGTSHGIDQTLNLTIVGDGTVLVMPVSPPGNMFECAAAYCGFQLPSGSMLYLAPNAGDTSMLSSWSGDCTGNLLCVLTMTGTKNVTATFGALKYFKLLGTPDKLFTTLNETFGAVATGSSATVLATGLPFQENLVLNRDVALTLSGGYDTSFTAAYEKTTLEGYVSISKGSLTVNNLIISSPTMNITDSTPGKNNSNTSIGTQLTVSISNKLDPATVNNGTVTLVGETQFGKTRVPGTVSYDNVTNTITFSHKGLESNTVYSLTFNGLKDTNGNFLVSSILNFKTRNDQILHSISYNKNGSHFDCILFTNGYLFHSFSRSRPGLDGTCFTYDETPYLTDQYLLNSDGGVSSQNHATMAGGQVLAANHSYNASKYRIKTVFTRTVSGAEATVAYLTYTYNANGYLTRITSYSGPGPDNIWFTNDDIVASYQSETYDSQSVKIKSVFYSAAGADGTWFNGDDVVESYQKYTRDGNGALVRTTVYSAAGADGVWQTADDVVGSYWQTSYGSNSLKSTSIHYGSAGSDGLWFTADDLVISYVLFQYDMDLNPTWKSSYGWPGPDGIWFTGDDIKMMDDEYTWAY